MRTSIFTAAIAALILLLAAPPAALAQPSEADLEKARQAFMKGRDLFEAKEFKGAVEAFKESYRLSRNALLLYNIGFTLEEAGDKSMALFYYKKFLDDAPPDAQNRGFVEERVKVLSSELEADLEPELPDEPPDEEPELPPVRGFMHNIVDEAPPGNPIDITCVIPDGSGWQVVLSFRAGGEGRFTSVEMRPRYNELVGRIPAVMTRRTTAVQYYLEARDRNGKVLARSGRSTSPNLIIVSETAAPRYYPDLSDEPNPLGGAGSGRMGGPTGDGSFRDGASSTFKLTKWTVTGGAVGLLGLSVTFYLVAADASSSLEGQALASTDPNQCANPPCHVFDPRRRELEAKGERYQRMTRVTLGVGLAAAAVAGGLWYWEIRQRKKGEEDGGGLSAAPVVAPGLVGAAASVRF